MAAAVFLCQACVTATIASYQVTVAEDELRHPCSTASDEIFTSTECVSCQHFPLFRFWNSFRVGYQFALPKRVKILELVSWVEAVDGP